MPRQLALGVPPKPHGPCLMNWGWGWERQLSPPPPSLGSRGGEKFVGVRLGDGGRSWWWWPNELPPAGLRLIAKEEVEDHACVGCCTLLVSYAFP
jgi:hypothetical protein